MSDYSDYKLKYLKYKSKYLSQKKINQKGGTKTQIVFSYQGAFAPPHLGHFNSANIFIEELKKRYPNNDYTINFMFMPTCNKSSKSSLSLANSLANRTEYVSEEDRKNMLDIYASILSQIHPGINITTSTIEFDICAGKYDNDLANLSYKSATINTLTILRKQNPSAIIGLGIGIDNGFEISTWSMMDKYVGVPQNSSSILRGDTTKSFEPVNLEFILMCDRKPNESAPAIDISSQQVLEKSVKIAKHIPSYIEAFVNTSTFEPVYNMYFKPKEGLDNSFDILVSKMTILDSPDEFSSSQVRKIIKLIYEIESAYLREDESRERAIDSVWALIINICGPEVTKYLRIHNIFNPNDTISKKRRHLELI